VEILVVSFIEQLKTLDRFVFLEHKKQLIWIRYISINIRVRPLRFIGETKVREIGLLLFIQLLRPRVIRRVLTKLVFRLLVVNCLGCQGLVYVLSLLELWLLSPLLNGRVVKALLLLILLSWPYSWHLWLVLRS
jgi:hypothetical protein